MGNLIKFPDVKVISNVGHTTRTMIGDLEHVVEYDSLGRLSMVKDTEKNGAYTRTVWDYENQKIYSETEGPRA